MQTPPAWETLKQFRLAAYQTLGRRKDSLFELLEAVLAGPGPAALGRLSLAAVFRRAWPSAPDALADGGVDVDRCRGVVQRAPIEPAPERPIWALDGTVWPRPSAKTSPERTYGHRTTAGIPQDGVVPAWEYEWLGAGPAPGPGRGPPVDGGGGGGHRRGATVGRRATRAERRDPDGGGDRHAAGGPGAAAGRCAAPGLRARQWLRPDPGGACRQVFRLADPVTHGTPDASVTLADPRCGRVQIDAWRELRARGAAD